MPENTSGYGTANPNPEEPRFPHDVSAHAEPAAEHIAAGDAADDPTRSPVSQAPEESPADPARRAAEPTETVPEEAQPARAERGHDEPTNAELARAELGSGESPAGEGVTMSRINKGPDLFFKGLAGAAALLLVAVVVFVAVFLIGSSAHSLSLNKANFLTSMEWSVDKKDDMRFGIWGLLWITTYSSVIALVLAVPVAIGIALLLTQYLRGKVSQFIGFLVDLLAAVPSVIYGLWGIKVLGPALLPAYTWMGEHWAAFPLFKPLIHSAGNLLTAGLVLAIMILPIITAISRDVFAQTPRDHVEAALALGATKWEVIRTAVLPYGRSGVVAAAMLGLGRALGETVAVMIILSATKVDVVSPSLFQGGATFASRIASSAGEFDTVEKAGAYIAAGLVLFIITFVVNALARVVAESGKAKA